MYKNCEKKLSKNSFLITIQISSTHADVQPRAF